MNDHLKGYPPRYLVTPEAARFLGLSPRTLEKQRTYGTGPRYISLSPTSAWMRRFGCANLWSHRLRSVKPML